MKSISRRQALKLMGVTSAGGVLAACAPAATPTAAPVEPTQAPEATKAPEATTAPEATKAPEPTKAPEATKAPELAPYELRYVCVGSIQKDMPAVQDALSAMLKEKINATVKLDMLDWGAYTDKVNLMVSSGEVFDVMFVCPWESPSYIQLISNGALAPLDDLLDKDAPETKKAVPAAAWNATKVDGKIYGVPNQQIWVKPFGPWVLNSLAEKYKFSLDSVKKLEDLEPFFAAVKKGEPGIFPCGGGSYIGEYFGFDPIVTQASQVSIKYDDKDLKVFNAYATPEFKGQVELMRKWYLAGYFPKDKIPDADVDGIMKAGKEASGLLGVVKPGGDLEVKVRWGIDTTSKNLSPVFMTTASVTATMTGVGATSKDPDRAMMFINLLNTDVALYNLLCKGIEGTHWVWVDKAANIIGPGPNQKDYTPGLDWEFGNVFNAYYNSKGYADIKFNEATAALNNGAAASAALGFAFNPDPVKTELAQVEAAVKELGDPLIAGMVDTADAKAGLDAFIKALNNAGMDKLMAEAQSQLNKWAGK
jgi:putative aldouronate transport system substrate-binding protein